MAKRTRISKNCLICNKQIEVKPSRIERTKYCSQACRNKGYTKRTERSCQICNKPFFPSNYQVSHGIGHFCSKICSGMFQSACQKGKKGRPLSEEHKNKIRLANKGIQNRLGHKATLETRLKKRLSAPRGEKNHLWRGGITPIHQQIRHSFEYKLWREAVYKRDNYACVLCGDDSGGNLQADHVKPFAYHPDLRFDVNNGRTLCVECHKQTDTWGYKARKLYEGIGYGI